MKAGKHICTQCNAIYEEPDNCAEDKKSFEELGTDWQCTCGATRDMYQPCSCVSVEATEHKHEKKCIHSK